MEEQSIRRIAMTGVGKADIVIYCAYALQKMEYKVLVWDETKSREMSYSIMKPDGPIDVVRYKNMDFAFSEVVSLEEGYDYVLNVRDFDSGISENAHKYVLICDGDRCSIDGLGWHVSAMKDRDVDINDCMILYRNVYGSYGADRAQTMLDCLGFSVFSHTLGHDCVDEACRERMQYRPFTSMADVSGEMERSIRKLLAFATGLDEKQIRRGIKLAKRGRAC